jgi:hypothetical protein
LYGLRTFPSTLPIQPVNPLNVNKKTQLKKEIDEKKQEQFGVFANPACTGN